MSKLNCWEFKECGREPGGANVSKSGECPAAMEKRLDGIHDGIKGGRSCWVLAGTMCGGETQGTFAKKFDNCRECNFYKKVKEEEGVDYQFAATLLATLRGE
ncbi:MAG: hypothetical protein GXP58_11870 [Deltaproteobacteria bacterium]|nr:hypothetical protein [Deltaproteobacteria bacterium]